MRWIRHIDTRLIPNPSRISSQWYENTRLCCYRPILQNHVVTGTGIVNTINYKIGLNLQENEFHSISYRSYFPLNLAFIDYVLAAQISCKQIQTFHLLSNKLQSNSWLGFLGWGYKAQRKPTRFSPISPWFDSWHSQELFSWCCWDLLTALLRPVDKGLINTFKPI